MELRPIQESDLPQLAQLYEQLGDRPCNRERLQEQFFQLKQNQDCLLLGVLDDGILLGSLYGIFCIDLVGACRPFLVLENMIVSSTARRQGIAKRLLNAMEQEARRRNCLYIMLVSRAQRQAAHALYKQCGFDGDVRGFKKMLCE